MAKNNRKGIVLVGDAHGKFDKLAEVCDNFADRTILVIGDVGLGFPRQPPGDPLPPNVFHFRGNHDNPIVCKAHPRFTMDYGMWKGLFIVGGAASIDAKWRTPGISWWADEQLSRDDFELATEAYAKAKPRVVVTHEAPFRFHKLLAAGARLKDPNTEGWGEPKGNATAFALDDMLRIHQPETWICGHWHQSLEYSHKEMRFICLDELEPMPIEDII